MRTIIKGNMIANMYIRKHREYLDYLEEHIEYVRLAFINTSKACEDMHWVIDDFTWHAVRDSVMAHDISKFHPEEFCQYRSNFYPIAGEVVEKREFATAWENHKSCNSHHHESIINDLDIVHMIIDWTAMGYKFGGTAQEFYESAGCDCVLNGKQRIFMYEVFRCISLYNDKICN